MFEPLAQHDFADIPHDALWSTCLVYLAEVCAFLGDVRRAAILYQLLRPYAGRNAAVGGAVVCHGPASGYLGLLAATMSHWEKAEEHVAEALAMNVSMGARPWLAHTQYDYATMLLARSQPGDGERASGILGKALALAQELGMRALEARVTARLAQMTSEPQVGPAYPDGLRSREVEVLRLIAAGKSHRDIADTLCISLNTVATHVRNILSKTGAANRTEAAAYALRQGLLQRP